MVCEDHMLSQTVRKYIDEHAFCSEYLFADWESFLDILYAEGGRVCALLWWDHCRKAEQHMSVGSGGYTDPADPDYMYAETQSWENGLSVMNLTELKEHIHKVREAGLPYCGQFTGHELVPSFYLDGE